jgi:hypothetical protein
MLTWGRAFEYRTASKNIPILGVVMITHPPLIIVRKCAFGCPARPEGYTA